MFDDNSNDSANYFDPTSNGSDVAGTTPDPSSGAPDIGQNASPTAPYTPQDASILNGQPGSPAGMDVNGNPTMGADSAYPSSGSPAPTGGLNASGDTYTTAGAPQGPAVPQAQGQPSVWKQVVFGALMGAFAGGGTRGFGEGMAAGSNAVQAQAQQKVENANKQQQLQFESLKAADMMIQAKQRTEAASREATKFQWEEEDHNSQVEDYNKANGIEPKATVSGERPSETHASAVGTLKTLAQGNGGLIPQVVTFDHPHTADDDTHSVTAYSTSTSDLTKNPTKNRKVVDDMNAAMGKAASTDDDWTSGFGKVDQANNVPSKGSATLAAQQAGQKDKINEAIAFQQVPPMPVGLKSVAELNAVTQPTLTNLRQNASNYANSPNPDPAYQKILDSKAETYARNAENTRSAIANSTNATTLQESPANAAAAGAKATSEDVARQNTPGGQLAIKEGQARLTKTQLDIEKTRQDLATGKAVYAVRTDPDGTPHTVLTTSADAAQSGLAAARPVKQADISKDQKDIKVLSDIQVKSDNVKTAAAAMDDPSGKQAALAAKLLSDNKNTTVNDLLQSEAYKKATPAVQQYVVAVKSLRESSMGLQKVLTGSARSNEAQIEALQATLPGVEPSSIAVHQKLQAFDQNLNLLSQGLPENTGVNSTVHKPEVSFTAPNGHMYFYKDQATMDAAKKKAGIK